MNALTIRLGSGAVIIAVVVVVVVVVAAIITIMMMITAPAKNKNITRRRGCGPLLPPLGPSRITMHWD